MVARSGCTKKKMFSQCHGFSFIFVSGFIFSPVDKKQFP